MKIGNSDERADNWHHALLIFRITLISTFCILVILLGCKAY